ncbi:MAG: hypothetical protein R6V08_08495 [Desulfuromonadales bacterium]
MAVNEEWISLADAAQKLGTTSLNVLMRVRRGQLVGTEMDGEWVIDAASLDDSHRQAEPAIDASPCSGCRSDCR